MVSESASRLDGLYGGILARTGQQQWTSIFPYSYYVSGPWLGQNASNLQKFKGYGYNILHVIPGGGIGYDFDELDGWFDISESIGLWVMLDMRWSYQNPEWVGFIVNRYRKRKNLLLWYTADEPGRLRTRDADFYYAP